MRSCTHVPVEPHEQKTVCRRCTATIENLLYHQDGVQWFAITPGKRIRAVDDNAEPVKRRWRAPRKPRPVTRKPAKPEQWRERRRAYLNGKGQDDDC